MRAVDGVVLAAWADAFVRNAVPDRSFGAFLHVAVVDNGSPRPFVDRLRELRDHGSGTIQLLLPVPGDPAGLDPSGDYGTAAIDAGLALIWRPNEVRDPRSPVLWAPLAGSTDVVALTEHRLAEPPPATGDVATAGRALAEAMRTAADDLAALDVAAGRDIADRHLDQLLRSDIGLPHTSDPRARDLLERALLVLVAVETARATPHAAVTSTEERLRAQSLRAVGAAARRATEAATASLAGTGR
jgi:hypothetical protein